MYVPLLVDDMQRFLDAFAEHDFAGFSVTIPHKVGQGAGGRAGAGRGSPGMCARGT